MPGCKCALQQAVENEWEAFVDVYKLSVDNPSVAIDRDLAKGDLATVELKDGQMKVVDVQHHLIYGRPLEQGSRDWAIAMMREGKTVVDSHDRKWRRTADGQGYAIERPSFDDFYPIVPMKFADGWRLA